MGRICDKMLIISFLLKMISTGKMTVHIIFQIVQYRDLAHFCTWSNKMDQPDKTHCT